MIGINHPLMRFSLDLNRYNCLSVTLSVCLSVHHDVLVLPLDMLQYDRHKPSVDEVLSRFKQV